MSKTKNNKKIKAILFDLGQVILDFDFEPAFRKLSRFTRRSPEQIQAYFYASGLEALYDGGKISSQTFHREVKKALGHTLDYNEFKKIWNNVFTLNPRVARLIKNLKSRYRLVLISNTNAMHYEYVRIKYPVLSCFDKHILSFKEKARKPDKRIYQTAVKACRARPAEILYIDDREDLIEAAKGLGFHTFTFKNNLTDLRNRLRTLRILES